MKTLFLLRHAKSSWKDSGCDDFDRRLNKRGQQAAKTMGEHLKQQDYLPDLILCSTAKRTIETMDYVLAQLPTTPEVKVVQDLYLAGAEKILHQIQGADRHLEKVMIIGHNPGMEMLAMALTNKKSSDPTLIDTMAAKYPTAALSILESDQDCWSDIGTSNLNLKAFVRPKDLNEKLRVRSF